MFYSIGQQMVQGVLLNEKPVGLSQLYLDAVVDGFQHQILETLDDIASTFNSPGNCNYITYILF